MSTPSEIDAWLELEEPEGPAPAFEITDEISADWAADKILTAEQRLQRIKQRSAAAIAQAEREVERVRTFFGPQLKTWALANLPRQGKTIWLPSATLSFRRVPGGPKVIDEKAALAWARAYHPAAVRTREELDKEAIKQYVATAGELPDGVEVVEAEDRFSLK